MNELSLEVQASGSGQRTSDDAALVAAACRDRREFARLYRYALGWLLAACCTGTSDGRSTARVLSWRVRAAVSASRALSWTGRGRIAATRVLSWATESEIIISPRARVMNRGMAALSGQGRRTSAINESDRRTLTIDLEG